MKKFLVIISALVLSQSVFASEVDEASVVDDQSSAVIELENGAMPSEEVNALLNPEAQPMGGSFKIGFEFGDNDDRWGGGHGGGWGGGHGGGHRREVICYAKNRRGDYFHARGWYPREVQQHAVEKCYFKSRFCRPVGCQY